MSNILKTFLAIVAVIGVVWRADSYLEARNDVKYASNDAVQSLARSVDTFVTEKRLNTVIEQLWDLNHSGQDLTSEDYRELELLEIKKGLLIKKLEGLGK